MTVSNLARKLGIKPGMGVLLHDAPVSFLELLGNLPDGAKLLKTASAEAGCVIAFVRTKAELRATAPTALTAVGDKTLLWFAYPKKSGPLQSDLSRDSGWEPLFEAGLDSVAQISIDETWTGFRFRPRGNVAQNLKEGRVRLLQIIVQKDRA